MGNRPMTYEELPNALSAQRCQELIDMAEEIGFEQAPVTTQDGPKMMLDYRNNERVIWFSDEFAEEVFEIVKDHAQHVPLLKPCGVNNMFRFYKYQPGHFFNQHRDGAYTAPNGNKSYVTVLIYLNEGYEGGETAYINYDGQWQKVKPTIGKIFLFDHKILHKSVEQEKGTKYVIRTDIMYTIK